MMRRARPVDLARLLALAALVLLALYGDRADVLIALVAAVPLVFVLALTRAAPRQPGVGRSPPRSSASLWIGLPLAHAVFLRELPHGDGLLIDVLVATFIGDTAAYFGGRLWGRGRSRPDLSPNKTVEGLVAGIVGGTVAFWCAGLYQDWLTGPDALLIGFLVAMTAPLGDLFESAVKRDLEGQGHRPLLRRARRRARPPRRGPLHGGRRVLRGVAFGYG